MSDCGFKGAEMPANGATLTLGVAYPFRIGVITDDEIGVVTDVQPVASVGTITKDPAGAVTIGDTTSGFPQDADFQVTPTSLNLRLALGLGL